jgi:hypothetical protein
MTWFSDVRVAQITSQSIIMEAPRLAVERIRKQWLRELESAISDAGGHGLQITLRVTDATSLNEPNT